MPAEPEGLVEGEDPKELRAVLRVLRDSLELRRKNDALQLREIRLLWFCSCIQGLGLIWLFLRNT